MTNTRYSISTKSGGEICLKDIVSNTILDLPIVLSHFLFCNRLVSSLHISETVKCNTSV